MKRILVAIVIAIPIVAAVLLATLIPASGTETCVPKDAWTETIEHDEVYHMETVVISPEQPAVPEIWANWSPNNTEGPQDYIPVWPQDDRGTWHVHDKIPGGHAGPDGVYQRDNPGQGNSDWFYRQNGRDYIPAVTEEIKVVDEEAWTEIIEHPAVVCDTPTETPTLTPTPSQNPTEAPTETPDPIKTPITCNGVHIPKDHECDDEGRVILDYDNDPVIEISTTHSGNKTTKVYTHQSGKTTTTVVHYDGDLKEEGL